jgi:hypothetical protein
MSDTIIGRFSSRREADLAIEHLVQEQGIERTDVFVQPVGNANSAGEMADGADVESGHPGRATDGDPALDGAIEVSVDVNDGDGDAIRTALQASGGEVISS